MKHWRLATLGILLFCGGSDRACADGKTPAGDQPAAFSLDRYQGMIDRSPFAVASQGATPPSAPDAVGFAKDLVLTGVVRLNDGEYVTIASRDQSQRFGLMRGETYNGITVASVEWSDAIGKTKVTLKRGSEYGVVSFDEAVVNNNGAAGAAPGGVQPTATILPAGITLPNPDATGNPPPSPGKPLLRRRVIQMVPPK